MRWNRDYLRMGDFKENKLLDKFKEQDLMNEGRFLLEKEMEE